MLLVGFITLLSVADALQASIKLDSSPREMMERKVQRDLYELKELSASESRANVDCESQGGQKWKKLPTSLFRIGSNGLYCLVPKAATSTIVTTIEALSEVRTPGGTGCRINCGDGVMQENLQSVVKMVQGGNESDVCNLLGGDAKWIIIRNPWDRVKSAYLDKVLDQGNGDKIELPGFGKDPPFLAYLNYLEMLDPTNESAWNPHAKPVSLACRTNADDEFQFKYDRVIRMETDFENQALSAMQYSGLDIQYLHKGHPTIQTETSLTREEFYARHGGQDAIDLVAKLYADDIMFGGYTFNPVVLASQEVGTMKQ